jgi:hypothetical protein
MAFQGRGFINSINLQRGYKENRYATKTDRQEENTRPESMKWYLWRRARRLQV